MEGDMYRTWQSALAFCNQHTIVFVIISFKNCNCWSKTVPPPPPSFLLLFLFTLYGHLSVTWLSDFISDHIFGLLSLRRWKSEHFENFPFFAIFSKKKHEIEKIGGTFWKAHKTRNLHKKFQSKILKYSARITRNSFYLIWAFAGHVTTWFKFWRHVWTPLII